MRTSVYLPDQLAQAAKRHGLSISQVLQDALQREIEKREAATKEFQNIVIDTAEGNRGFLGRWLTAKPVTDQVARSAGGDAPSPLTSWWVAITAKGRYVVRETHHEGSRRSTMHVCESQEEVRSLLPLPIYTKVFHTTDVVWMDI